MKKLVLWMLMLALAVGLCACGKPKAEAVTFQAGFGRVSIMPQNSVPLAGYGNTTSRMSQGFLDYLYASCVALRDAKGCTVLFVTADIININDSIYQQCADAISDATGVAKTNIFISATHTHSAPDLASSHSTIVQYKTLFQEALVQACQDAIKDLANATVQTGSVEVEAMTFVRHYLMNDGTYYGDNFGSTSSGYKAHEREADKQMQLVRFVRQKKQDIVMVNWQAHAKVASTGSTTEGRQGRSMLSADYIGAMRQHVEEKGDCLVAFYLGAAGNLNPKSNLASEADVPRDVRAYGKQLGDWVLQGMENMTQVEAGAIVTKQIMYDAKIDHTEDHLLNFAQPVAELWAQTNDYNLCMDKENGVMSPYHALGIINRQKAGQSKQMQINAVSIGSVGFVTAPFEMFCQNAQAIKTGSPYDTTMVITCTNGHNSYIAADSAFEYGAYEVHYRTFVRGTAEQVQNEMIAMLTELKG